MATKKKKIYVSLEDVAKLNKNTTSTNPLYQLSNPTKEMQDYDNFAKKIDYSKVYAPKDNTDFGLHWSTPLDILKNTVGLVGGSVTTGLYNRIKDVKKFSQDPSLLGVGKLALDLTPIPDATKIGMDAIKGQKKAWTDNKYSWSDVPLVGALKGIGDKQKYGEDILNEVGMKEGIGRTALGVGLDIALDPLTYLTGGAATASKMGKIAEAEKIANVADDLSVVGKFKNVADFTPEMEKALIQKHPNLVRNNPELFDKLVTKKLDGINNARNIAYNANINKRGLFAPMTNKGVLVENLPVPFANKLGNVAEKSLLFRSESKVKPQLVDDLITKLTQNGEYSTDEVRQMIKNHYGTDELTKNQFSNLYDKAQSVIKKNPDVSIAPTGNMETKVVDEILKGDKVNYEKYYSGALKTVKNKEQRTALTKILNNYTPEEFSQLSDKELISLMKKEIETGKAKIPNVFGSLDKETAKNLKKTFNSKSFIKAVKSVREEVTKTIPAVPEQKIIKKVKALVPDEEILLQRKRNLDESQNAFNKAYENLVKYDEGYTKLQDDIKKGEVSIADIDKRIKELNSSVDPKVEKELSEQLAKDKENLEIAKAQLNGKPLDETEKNILFGQAAKGFNDFKTKLTNWVSSKGSTEKPMYKDLLSNVPIEKRTNLRFALTDLINSKYGDLTGASSMTQSDYAEILNEALKSPRLNKKVASDTVQADIDFFSKQIPKGEQKLAEIAEIKKNHASSLEGLIKQKEDVQKTIDEHLKNLSLTKEQRAEVVRIKNEALSKLKVAEKEHSKKAIMKEVEKEIEEIIPEIPEKTITKTVIKKGTAKDVDSPKVKLLDTLKKIGLQKLEEPITKQLNLVPVEKQAEVMEKLDKAVSRYDEVISEFRRNAKGKASLEKVENQGTEILHREVEHIFNSYVKGTPEELLNKQKRNVSKLFEGSKTEIGDFKTKFEHILDKKNPFNARTLNSNDKLLNNMGDVITDAESEKAGYIKFHQKALNEIKTDFEKLATTEADKKKLWEEIGYVLEKEVPRSYGENWKAPKEVQAIAEKVKDVLGKVGQDEVNAGVLKGLNENYFMHNVNQNHPFIEKGEKALKNKISEIRGKKASNVFGQKREGFQTLAEWRNKIEDLQDELKNLTGDANKKKRLSIHREIDFLNDLYDLSGTGKLQERVNASASAINNKKMFDELRKFGMFAEGSEGIGKHDLVPFNTLAREMNMTSGELANKFGLEKGKTYRMSREVFEGLKRNNEIFKSENVEKAMNSLDKVSDAFRALTTYYKPSHFTNNALGNVLNNAFFGVKPSDYTGATKLLKGYANGTLSESESKIMELAFKKNIISGGSYVDIKESNLLNDNPLTRFMRHGKFTKEGAAKGNRLFSGEMIEDVSRLANFLNGMDKYSDVSKAAKQVREALFNYNELSNADRKMRRLIPFWNWTKNNLPLQVKQLMENPKYALNIQRFKDMFNDGQEGEDWQKEYGVKLGDRYYSFQSPTNDLNFFDNPIKALASGVTPPLRMPIEWYANKKMYTGKPISYPNGSGVNGARMEDLPNYLFSNFGVLKNANDLMSVDEKSKKTKKDVLLNLLVPNTKINK